MGESCGQDGTEFGIPLGRPVVVSAGVAGPATTAASTTTALVAACGFPAASVRTSAPWARSASAWAATRRSGCPSSTSPPGAVEVVQIEGAAALAQLRDQLVLVGHPGVGAVEDLDGVGPG